MIPSLTPKQWLDVQTLHAPAGQAVVRYEDAIEYGERLTKWLKDALRYCVYHNCWNCHLCAIENNIPICSVNNKCNVLRKESDD